MVGVLCALALGVALNSAAAVLLWHKQDVQIDRIAKSTVALCALRADLQARVRTATQFLAEHPDGAPGIPARTIRDGIANQQRTISALRVVKCPR